MSVETTILSSKLFWTKYFSTSAVHVPWIEFAKAFELEYGPHPTEAMMKLHQAFVMNKPSEEMVVHAKRLHQLTQEHHGLYEAFVFLADPGKAVFVLGSVSDDSSSAGQRNQPSPEIFESLLGINVVQISCGGASAMR